MIEKTLTARLVRHHEPIRASIHEQGIAQSFGFNGALVPGIDIGAWLMNPICDLWGADWIARGTIELKNIRPVYDGQEIVLSLEPDGQTAKLEVRTPAGETLAVGTATLPAAPPEVRLSDYPFREYDDPRPLAVPGLLAQGQLLGGSHVVTDRLYADRLRERSMAQHPSLTGDILHPLAFQHASTWDSMNSLDQPGPGIHVWGEAIHLRAVPIGAELASAGSIASVWERKGNHYMQTAQLVTADGLPAALVRRNVIFSLAKATA